MKSLGLRHENFDFVELENFRITKNEKSQVSKIENFINLNIFEKINENHEFSTKNIIKSFKTTKF